MHIVRVIGRIDLATQLHAALAAAGIDARLTTAGPASVVAATGQDGSEIDFVADNPEICAAIKKADPGRPVVSMIHASPADLALLVKLQLRRGADAYAPWSASGEDLVAACDRAKASVGRPRRLSALGLLVTCLFLLPFLLLAAAFGALVWAVAVRGSHAGRFVLPLLFASMSALDLVFAGFKWISTRGRPQWERVRRVLRQVLFAALLAGAAIWALGR